MRVSGWKVLFGCVVVAAGSVAPVSAQEASPFVRVAGAFSTLSESVLGEDYTDKGFQVDAAVPILRIGRSRVEAVADFSRHHNEAFDDHLTAILGGGRIALIGRVIPFGQFLIGTEKNQGSGFAIQYGGGVDVPVHRMVAVRVGVDGRRARYDGPAPDGAQTFTGLRTTFGVVFGLGARE